jgi:streptogramin lyase
MHRLTLATLAALGLLATYAQAAPTITEYTGPMALSSPVAIAAGPDGNLWFTESSGHRIGRITPTGALTEFPVPSASGAPTGIAPGPDGNLWFTEYSANRIGRMAPTGVANDYPVTTAASGPNRIATGPDGNLWFAQYDGSRIGRITPNGAVTEFPTPTGSSGPWGIAAGPDGNLWFTEDNADRIGRITTTGTITEFPLAASRTPEGITAGPDGNLWFTEYNGGRVGRITPGGTITEFPIPGSSQPIGIAVGPDGNLWFADVLGARVGRVTTSGTITTFPTPTANSGPFGIAAGPDGNLWFTESIRYKIGRITTEAPAPTTGNLLRNSGAEEGTPVAGDALRTTPVLGWAVTPNFTPVAYGTPPADQFPGAAESARIAGGNAFFAGGPANPGSRAIQNVDVAAQAAGIDDGRATAAISAQIGGTLIQPDSATLTARFLDANLNPLGSIVTAPVTPTDRGNQTRFVARSASGPVPAGTRTIQVIAETTRPPGSTYNNGYLDNLSLTLDVAPAPVETPGTPPAVAPPGGAPPSSTAPTPAAAAGESDVATAGLPTGGPTGGGSSGPARCTLAASARVTGGRLLATATCDVKAALTATATLNRPTKPVTLATAGGTATPGQPTQLTLTLGRSAQRAIKRAKRATTRLDLTATTPDGARSTATTSLGRLKLTTPKRKRGHR